MVRLSCRSRWTRARSDTATEMNSKLSIQINFGKFLVVVLLSTILATSCSSQWNPPQSTGIALVGVLVLILIAVVLWSYLRRVREIQLHSQVLAAQVQIRTHELERRNLELEALYDADEELYRYLELDQVLNALIKKAVDILAADKASLMIWDKEREKLEFYITFGFQSETVSNVVFAPGEGVAGQVVQHGEPAIVEDTLFDERVTHAITDVEGIRSFMQVPIKIGGEVFGVFSADYLHPRGFTDDELRLLVALAQRAAMAIENAQHYQQAQELAALEERQRLARDLHDAVSQSLFSSSLIAEAIPDVWASDPDQGLELLEKLRRLNRGALAEMRALLMELRPEALVEAEMRDLLRQIGQAVSGREGIPVNVEVEELCTIPFHVKIALYRIAQEALNNAVKHSRANQIGIQLNCIGDTTGAIQPTGVELRIQDDGCGFELEKVSQEHLGLMIMRERAESIDAEFEIHSQSDCGTLIRVIWKQAERKD